MALCSGGFASRVRQTEAVHSQRHHTAGMSNAELYLRAGLLRQVLVLGQLATVNAQCSPGDESGDIRA